MTGIRKGLQSSSECAFAFGYNSLVPHPSVPEASSFTPDFEPRALLGMTLDGRYRLTGHLATGGMGAVFRAQHIHLCKDVALKVMRPDLSSSPDLVARFRREAQIASALTHPNIVSVSDFGRSREGYLFLAMDLLQGESLFERLRREAKPLPVDETLEILIQVCAGLDAAHQQGVVHRDLKPENVFLELQGSRTVARVLDFGIAKLTDPSSPSDTHTGIVVGTPEYVSPEQALGMAVDPRADLYAVGLVAWRMLAGHHPFQSNDPRAILMMQATHPVPPITDARPDLAPYPALVKTVAWACAKSVASRPSSAAELKGELERCAQTPWEPSVDLPPRPQAMPVKESITTRIRPSLRFKLSLRLARVRATLRRLIRRVHVRRCWTPGKRHP